ncbi:MAG: DNA repair protein RecN [Desulfobacterales bacterium]|jgi:DNA repair protein RecN (Recombination protein N)|nr:DNA repair protein RecN [Desulfobacterales bacterium]
MLRELSIRNFAIIDDLHIRFAPGLTILSGETGAGKSIIINAVNLILGSRAAAEMIRTGADSAELEAIFDIGPESPAGRAAAAMGYETGDGLLVRRVIARAEGNRVYVNGRLATLQVLAAVTENLASISGQHAHQGLLKEDQHLLVLDQFAGLLSRREAVSRLYHEILPQLKRLNDLKQRQARQAELAELLGLQEREIVSAAIAPGEDLELEQERVRLKNAGALMEAVQGSLELLYGASGAATDRLAEARRSLEKAARIDPGLSARAETCAEITYRIEDLVQSLRAYLRSVEFNDRRQEEVEQRLDTLNRLKRKHGGSLEAVLAKLAGARAELAAIEHLDLDIAAAADRLQQLRAAIASEATALSQKRRQAAKRLAAQVAAELSALKMAGTQFAVAISPLPAAAGTDPSLVMGESAVSESGIDRAVFTIAPNVGEALKPLSAIASGGELSRVVLALKSILAASESVATIVFDEVDAGIGGAVAEVVGRTLAALARRHQVLCITHLPQIAKFADHHFKISKQVVSGRTRTAIAPLSSEDRTREIARMLGGEKITRVTLEHARELLGRVQPKGG